MRDICVVGKSRWGIGASGRRDVGMSVCRCVGVSVCVCRKVGTSERRGIFALSCWLVSSHEHLSRLAGDINYSARSLRFMMSVERQRLVTISPLRSGLNVPSLSASGRQALSASLALLSSQLPQTLPPSIAPRSAYLGLSLMRR